MSPITLCRRLVPTVTGVFLFASSAAVLAAPGAGPSDGRPAPGARLCAKLSCTDAQAQKVGAILKDLKADTQADREAIGTLHREVMAEFAKEKPDEAKMKKAYAKIDQHHAAIRTKMHDAAMELHAVLDAGQRQQLAEMIGDRGLEKMLRAGGRHGKGKGKPGRAGQPGAKRKT